LGGLLCLAVLWGCESGDFEKARSEDTVEAYQEYLENHPEGENADRARHRIERLSYERARDEGTVEAFRRLLQEFPEGELAERAREQIESLEEARQELKHARQKGTYTAMERFVNYYSYAGRYYEEGMRELEKFTPLERSKLFIPGSVSPEVNPGVVEFLKSPKTEGAYLISIAKLKAPAGKFCPCCMEKIRMDPDLRVSMRWFRRDKNESLRSGLRRSALFEITSHPEAELAFVSGPEGAMLIKREGGFVLKEGKAYYWEP